MVQMLQKQGSRIFPCFSSATIVHVRFFGCFVCVHTLPWKHLEYYFAITQSLARRWILKILHNRTMNGYGWRVLRNLHLSKWHAFLSPVFIELALSVAITITTPTFLTVSLLFLPRTWSSPSRVSSFPLWFPFLRYLMGSKQFYHVFKYWISLTINLITYSPLTVFTL
jgi:hypothetical protein